MTDFVLREIENDIYYLQNILNIHKFNSRVIVSKKNSITNITHLKLVLISRVVIILPNFSSEETYQQRSARWRKRKNRYKMFLSCSFLLSFAWCHHDSSRRFLHAITPSQFSAQYNIILLIKIIGGPNLMVYHSIFHSSLELLL